ncbi:MAG: hypothetical protein IPM79_16220 [Polyangiaceae bacterium]|jgi:phospholipase/carboxylesterase|nr:hypothetical protein [Polyangiaceae bacterium]MBK8939125.1 hypothetical protein [Polyangiaceae bacterium]
MKRQRAGELDVWSAGGDDGDGGGSGPAVVLCHGFGAPGDDLVPLWREIDVGRGVRWFFPEAPLRLELGFGGDARAWWPIDMLALERALRTGSRDELANTTPDGLAEARAALEGCLEALERDRGLDRSRALLGGFSQGAMVTTEISLFADRPFAGLVVLSGTLLCRERWRAAAAATAAKLSVLQTHGRRDALLPFSLAEELRDLLTAAGASVELIAHGGGHELPAAALDALGRFARARLATSG